MEAARATPGGRAAPAGRDRTRAGRGRRTAGPTRRTCPGEKKTKRMLGNYDQVFIWYLKKIIVKFIYFPLLSF